MNKEAQDFERWLREKLYKYLTFNKLDESMVVDADPHGERFVDVDKPLPDHVTDTIKLIKEANTEDK